MLYQHARLSPAEQTQEAQAFLAWWRPRSRGPWENRYEDWALHLLPGDWHRVRRIVEARLSAGTERHAA